MRLRKFPRNNSRKLGQRDGLMGDIERAEELVKAIRETISALEDKEELTPAEVRFRNELQLAIDEWEEAGKVTVFIDGTGITPGTEKCKCTNECEFPCWQRLGWAPACTACHCPPFVESDEDGDDSG